MRLRLLRFLKYEVFLASLRIIYITRGMNVAKNEIMCNKKKPQECGLINTCG